MALFLLAGPAAAAKPAPFPEDPATAEAKRAFAEGERAYKMGRFEEALAAFGLAYEKRPIPGFLFNLGQCHKQLKHHERAVFFFEGYLRDKPDAKNRATVELLLGEERALLQARLSAEAEVERLRLEEEARAAEERRREDERRQAAFLAPAPSPPPEEPELYERWWFWAAVGGVAIAAGGTALALSGGAEAPPDVVVAPTGSLGTFDRRSF